MGAKLSVDKLLLKTPRLRNELSSDFSKLSIGQFIKKLNRINRNSSLVFPTAVSNLDSTSAASLLASCRNTREIHRNACDMKEGSGGGSKKSKIVYSIIPRERTKQIAKFLSDNYHQTEPISVALGLDLTEIKSWFPLFLRMTLMTSVTDVSVQAIDESTLTRVAVLASIIVDPMLSEPPLLSSFVCPERHPVNVAMNEFFDTLEKDLDKVKEAGINVTDGERPPKILEHLYISCIPEYAGQGISKKLVEISELVASNIINCRVAHAVTTSEFSHALFTKSGYNAVREIQYKDYENSKGEKIFADKLEKLKPHFACRSVVKQLKDYYD